MAAKLKYGLRLKEGIDVPADLAEAGRYLKMAADKGKKEAQ